MDTANLVSKFYFHYGDSRHLHTYLEQVACNMMLIESFKEFWNLQSEEGQPRDHSLTTTARNEVSNIVSNVSRKESLQIADYFVLENARILHAIKNETALVEYFRGMACVTGECW